MSSRDPFADRQATGRRRVRWFFLALFVVLPAQYAVVGVVGTRHQEPWPALVMPAFQRVHDMAHPVSVRHTHLAVTCGGVRVDSLGMADFFDEVPESHYRAFAAAQLQPRQLSGTPATERIGHPDAAAWAAEKLGARYPLTPPCRLGVVWADLTLMPEGSGARVRYQPLDTLSVALADPAPAPVRRGEKPETP